ncbi:ThuA domain-containing protein [Oceanirhabdus sp. W0125-5]|uniref:ThuA domain-containing protein n=1 Tax=Oceanirhabdus sp. W0125-5 TaxID=2999116 RepID=UPI0022F2B655|nr:ThuA domain-containing protein [Oceanirhabdus sp. W0125-5]WBW97836.1 ThuA domain-containing protein [Oceanirhabdus sp. W0125-5]
MKKALIIWGGWEGHTPELIANRIGEILEKDNYNVTITCDFAILINDKLIKYDVIVPVWSCGIKSNYYLKPLLEAVNNGVGLATFHGGINWFEDEEYYKMIGALYLYDSNEEEYTIKITDKKHPITVSLDDFNIISEKYYIQVDPSNNVLAAADFSGIKTPISWTRNYGKGRIFYTSLAHSSEQFFSNSNMQMILSGIKWCSNY